MFIDSVSVNLHTRLVDIYSAYYCPFDPGPVKKVNPDSIEERLGAWVLTSEINQASGFVLSIVSR